MADASIGEYDYSPGIRNEVAYRQEPEPLWLVETDRALKGFLLCHYQRIVRASSKENAIMVFCNHETDGHYMRHEDCTARKVLAS